MSVRDYLRGERAVVADATGVAARTEAALTKE